MTDASSPTPKEKVDAVTGSVVDAINAAADSPYIQVTVSHVTPKISAAAREVIYNAGIVLGVIGTIAVPIAAIFTGNAQYLITAVGTVSLALTNALARLNLSKTAKDLGAEA